VTKALGLTNVTALHARVEELKMRSHFDFIVSRAVAPLAQLMPWCHPLLSRKHQHAYPNGLVALKGGNLGPEIAELPGRGADYTELFRIRDYFDLPFFDEKWVVYVQG
jgi:16S rRNA (guanine527-N7)-methyltransferase